MLVRNTHACGETRWTLHPLPPPLSLPLSLFLSAGECESICFRRQHVRPSADRTGSWMDSHSPPVIDSSTYSQSRHRGSCRVGHISLTYICCHTLVTRLATNDLTNMTHPDAMGSDTSQIVRATVCPLPGALAFLTDLEVKTLV